MKLLRQRVSGTILISLFLFMTIQYGSKYESEYSWFEQYTQEFPKILEVSDQINISKVESSDTVRNSSLLQHVFYTPPSFVLRKDYYIPSYYQLRLGVMYQQFNNSLFTNSSIIPLFNIGSKYSILTNSLPIDLESTPSDYISSVHRWNTSFEIVQEEVNKAFESNNVRSEYPEAQTNYSVIHVWRNRNSNSRVMFAQNVCFKPYSGTILLYFPVNVTLDRSLLGGGFHWGWTIQELHKEYPYREKDITSGTVITFPPFRDHIYHALEGVGLLLHKLFSAEELPYMAEVINSGVSERDMPWIKEMLELLIRSIPLNEPLCTLDQVIQHPANRNGNLCFRTVTFFDRMKQGGHGGFLPGFLGTDWIRSLVYKRFNLQPLPLDSTPYQLLFVQRSHNRKWVNALSVKKSIRKRWSSKVQIVDYELSTTFLSNQVKVFYRVQIMLTPHGAGMTNAIFMVPHSVVIEVTPPHFTDFCLSTVLHHARLHYIYIPNFDYQPLVTQEIPFPDEAYSQNAYASVRSRYKNLDLSTSLFQLLAGMEDAIAYLDHHRERQVNDYLSPIFV